MKFVIKNMEQDIVKQIIAWKYEGMYSEYNMDSYEELIMKNSSIINPEKRNNYLCYFENNELIGYTNTVLRKRGDVFLGIGIAPIHCGKGMGAEILRHSISEAKKKYPNNKITLQVRSWNKRAIKCYEKVGFSTTKIAVEKDHNNIETEFVFMEYML